MIETTKMNIEGVECEAVSIKTENSNVFLIKTKKGFIGCGYFDVEAANKFHDAVAIVSGVTNLDEMLSFPVAKISEKAKILGINDKMKGKDALMKLG
ncbi:MAG TPA: DUF1805 domain-containing protein [Candidatus Nanoarchaeia archaeon]|nr:DUF1805 domain-containing protein [Candidatus Nanoarchaeia archaeon]